MLKKLIGSNFIKNKKNTKILILIGLSVVYIAFALSYSLLTPAWEANDEADHTVYAEYIVAHNSIPRISLKNGHESHQPPLFYISLAVWQDILHIPSFHYPALIPNAHYDPNKPSLELSHNYSTQQRQLAIDLHKLRLLSVFFGLGTVILTFLIADALTKKLSFSIAATLFVIFLPKQLVVNAVITNDSLVIMLCSLLLFIAILLSKAKTTKRTNYLSLLLGCIAGAAILTKLNSLPITFFVLCVLIFGVVRKRFTYRVPLIYLLGLIIVSGPWLLYNWKLYGDPLAQTISSNYLISGIPRLIRPVSWFNTQRFLHFLPSQLEKTAWYDGGWNQLVLPGWMNISLWILAGISLVGVGRRVLNNLKSKNTNLAIDTLLLLAFVAGAIVAYLIIGKTTLQGEGRVTYVGLSAFAILCLWGVYDVADSVLQKLKNAIIFIWPVSLLLLNTYVLIHIVIPLRGL